LRLPSVSLPRAEREGGRSRLAHLVAQNVPLLLAYLVLVGMVVVYCVLYLASTSQLPGSFEVISTLDNGMPLAFAGAGQTIVVLTGGIDLSVGGMVDLTNALTAVHMSDSPGSIALWTAIVVLVGAAGGLLNGALVAFGRLQPILVTLATLSIYQGLAIRVLPQPGGHVPKSLSSALTNPSAPTALIWLALLIVAWLALRRTRLGVGIFAVGNDQKAARAIGIRVRSVKVGAYVLGGVLSALAGLFLAASATSGDATSGDVFTLTSIAAAVLGGVSFMGGRGSLVGTLAGAFALTLLVNVLFFAHINPLYQSFYQGVFLIAAVLVAGLAGILLRRR
jgi:ribose transport system permease protein